MGSCQSYERESTGPTGVGVKLPESVGLSCSNCNVDLGGQGTMHSNDRNAQLTHCLACCEKQTEPVGSRGRVLSITSRFEHHFVNLWNQQSPP